MTKKENIAYIKYLSKLDDTSQLYGFLYDCNHDGVSELVYVNYHDLYMLSYSKDGKVKSTYITGETEVGTVEVKCNPRGYSFVLLDMIITSRLIMQNGKYIINIKLYQVVLKNMLSCIKKQKISTRNFKNIPRSIISFEKMNLEL